MLSVRGAIRGRFRTQRMPITCIQPSQSTCIGSHSITTTHINLQKLTKSVPQFPTARWYHCSKPYSATLSTNPVGTSSRGNTVSQVPITINGTSHRFSAILLRDLCECPACVHESTKQKLYSTADIPASIQARSVNPSKFNPDTVDIHWNHDAPGFDPNHTTTISINSLKQITKSGELPNPLWTQPASPVTWNRASSTLPDFDYDAYMQDESTLLKVIEQLQTHGLVFITNVPGIEKSVTTIAERIGPVKDTFYGHSWDVRTVPQAINAAYTSGDLGFHTDLLYFQSPPHIQLLHCIQSSSSGGASVFADAFRAAMELYETDVDAFNVLATLPVNYHYKHPDSNVYHATKPVFDMRPLRIADTTYNTLSDFLEAWEDNRHKVQGPTATELPPLSVVDCLEKINWGPPFLAPFSLQQESMEQARGSGDPRERLNQKIDEWHAAAQKFSGLLHRHDALHERLMRPGECVLFNNTRVLHARKAFNSGDVGKARWLRGTYVDKDPFFSKLRVLRHKFDTVPKLDEAVT